MSEPSMPPAIADDPFWRVVHQRHPDVNIVLLPEPVPAPAEPVPGTYQRAEWLSATCESTLNSIQERLGHAFDARTGFWVFGERTGQRQYAATAALSGLPRGEVVTTLRAIGDALLELGWDARPSIDGTLAIRAVGDEMLTRVEASESMIALEVRTAALPLTDAEADALEAGGA